RRTPSAAGTRASHPGGLRGGADGGGRTGRSCAWSLVADRRMHNRFPCRSADDALIVIGTAIRPVIVPEGAAFAALGLPTIVAHCPGEGLRVGAGHRSRFRLTIARFGMIDTPPTLLPWMLR